MNNVEILGRLTNDLEIKKAGEIDVCNFTVAVSRIAKKDETDFINCTCFGKSAEALVNYAKKGSRVAVEGSIRVEAYTDKDGNKRTSTKVLANRIDIIDFKEKEEAPKEERPDYNASLPAEVANANDNDLPF